MLGKIVDIDEAFALVLLTNQLLMNIELSQLNSKYKIGDTVNINVFSNNATLCIDLIDTF